MKKVRAIALGARAIHALKQKTSCVPEDLRQLCSDPENMSQIVNLMIAQGMALVKDGRIVLGDGR